MTSPTPRGLKVYGWTGSHSAFPEPQVRIIVAARSWREAARLGAASSVNAARSWGSVTSNDREVELAMARPGVVFGTTVQRFGEPYVVLDDSHEKETA